MDEIVAAVKRVTDIMGEISRRLARAERGHRAGQQAVTQMDQITQQNAALVEEAAAAAESLKDQAETLKQAVDVFKLRTDGSKQLSNAARMKSIAKPAQASHTSTLAVTSRKERRGKHRIAEAREDKDGEWKEF